MSAGARPVVTLYSGEDCGLCLQARELLVALAGPLGFTLEEIEVATDADLAARYRYAVPVIAVAGQEVARAPIRPALLEAALREALRMPARRA